MKKRMKIGQKMKYMNPKGQKRPRKCARQNATTIYFLCIINDCVQLVTYATIHE